MLNQTYYPIFREVLRETELLLSELHEDDSHYRLLQRALGKLRQDFLKDKVFPALIVPGLAWQALGREESRALWVLNAAHYLFYAFLDLTDDIEDRELTDPLWRQLGDPLAINAGTGLLFASLLMLDRLKGEVKSARTIDALRRLFILAGWQLTAGQHRDLASSRVGALSVEEVLRTHELKTGTSVALYLESAALLAGAKPAQRRHFAALGRALGVMVQIRGDWVNVLTPFSSDLANACQSLPLALLNQRLDVKDAEVYQAVQLRAAEDPAAHDIMRHLLAKYAVAGPMHELLEARRTDVLTLLAKLERSGCEIEALNGFVERFQPIQEL